MFPFLSFLDWFKLNKHIIGRDTSCLYFPFLIFVDLRKYTYITCPYVPCPMTPPLTVSLSVFFSLCLSNKDTLLNVEELVWIVEWSSTTLQDWDHCLGEEWLRQSDSCGNATSLTSDWQIRTYSILSLESQHSKGHSYSYSLVPL